VRRGAKSNIFESVLRGYVSSIMRRRTFKNCENLAEMEFRSTAERNSRARILRTAAAIFAYKGYAGATIKEIVETAKAGQATLYHHFKDKRSLYVTLLDDTMSAFCAVLEPRPAEPPGVKERLRSLFLRVENFLLSHPNETRMVNSHLYGPPSGAPRYRLAGHSSRIEDILGNLLLPAVTEGKIREEELGAFLLLVLSLLRDMQRSTDSGTQPDSRNMQQYFKALDFILEG